MLVHQSVSLVVAAEMRVMHLKAVWSFLQQKITASDTLWDAPLPET